MDTKLCARCGSPFARNRKYTRAQWERATYCSTQCGNLARRKERRLCACGCGVRASHPSSRWRPGHNPQDERRKLFVFHTIRGKPRWYITAPSGTPPTPWARVVMERLLGRPLKAEEVVHHVNGDSTDDRPDNLQLFASHSEHMREEFKNGVLVGLRLGPGSQRRERVAA